MPQRSPCWMIPFLAAVLAATTLAACHESAPTERVQAPAVVTTTRLATQPWHDSLQALGTAQARESVTITAKVSDVVTRLAFDSGDHVRKRRDAGLWVREAILDAATTRMRPILMTSVATIAGAMPLMLATGAGAGSRSTIGVVVVCGIALSTLLSLFVVPAFYLFVAPHTKSPEERTQRLDRMETEVASVDDAAHG